MRKTNKVNQGFSLIELLISVTILSIVMVMVVQFMSTSSAAYRKNKKNLNIQTEAMKVVEQISDILMQANYIRVQSIDGKMYTITQTTSNERVVTPDSTKGTVDYDFVPDNYSNYSEKSMYQNDNRKVIINYDTFEIVDEKGTPYPLNTDQDNNGSAVRSFRALKSGSTYNYIMPKYIYAEYTGQKEDGTETIVRVIYCITDITDAKNDTRSVYMKRYEIDKSDDAAIMALNYQYACKEVNLATTGKEGLLTDKVADFYLSADSEGNALLTDVLFQDDKYEYNTVETINLRNSNVLTVRPQKLYRVKGTGTGGSGSPTP